MRNNFKIIAAVAVAFVAYTSIFVVNQFEQVIVLEFRKPVRIVKEPGLQFKAPWQSVQFFDQRVLDYNTYDQRVMNNRDGVITVISGDQKRLEMDAYLKYRITDPRKFLESVGNEIGLTRNIDPILESSMRKVISEVALSSLLTEKRVKIMQDIREQVNNKAKIYGIEVVDVRIISADFPEKNREEIYQRMITELEREAKKLRATGAEEATKIRAGADREKTVLLAEAEKKSQVLKGEGDGQAAKIYADAFNQDPEFFKFYRTMEAYRGSINKDDTKVILSPKSGFFNMMDGE